MAPRVPIQLSIFPPPYQQLYPNELSFDPPPVYGPLYQPIAFSNPPRMMRDAIINGSMAVPNTATATTVATVNVQSPRVG